MPDPNLMTTIAMIALMFVAFYFLILRPQKKRAEQQRQTLNSLEPGVRVLTSTGVYGKLLRIGEKQAVIELSPGNEMTIVKHAIAKAVVPGDEDLEMESASDSDERSPQAYDDPAYDDPAYDDREPGTEGSSYDPERRDGFPFADRNDKPGA